MRDLVARELGRRIDQPLVSALLDAYQTLTENFHLGRWRAGELEAGDFAEVCYRSIQWLTSSPSACEPLGTHLRNLPARLRDLENLPATHHASLRLHIPRALLLATDIRNQRGVAHAAGDVSANLADASLVLAVCSWVLAELVRLNFSCSPTEAQHIVDDLVSRKTPLIQDFAGFLKILNPRLPLQTKIMALLWQRGAEGASNAQLSEWLQLSQREQAAFRTALWRLDRERGWVHRRDGVNIITLAGIAWVGREPSLVPVLGQ